MKIKMFNVNQNGYTLLELLVVIAIAGAIITACVMTAWSILLNSDKNNARVEAVLGIEHAAQWISMDGMTARLATIDSGGDSITLQWWAPAEPGEAAGDLEEVVYSLSGNDLQRIYTIGAGDPTTRIVAQNVKDIDFSPEGEGSDFNNFKEFTVSITASGGSVRISEMREYDITLRPDA